MQERNKLGGVLRSVCGGAVSMIESSKALQVKPAMALMMLVSSMALVSNVHAGDDGASEDSSAAAADEEGSDCGDCEKKATTDQNEGDVCDDESDCDKCSSNSPDDEDNTDQTGDQNPAPVTSDTGEKWEIAHDLVVKLPGRDFRLTRQYSSDPRLANNPYATPYMPDRYMPPLDGNSSYWPNTPGSANYLIRPGRYSNGNAAGAPPAPNVGAGWGFSNLRSVSIDQRQGCVYTPNTSGPSGTVSSQFVASAAWVIRPGRKPRMMNLPLDITADSIKISDPANGPGNQSFLVYDDFERTVIGTQYACIPNGGHAANFFFSGTVRFQEPGKWAQEFVIDKSSGFISLDEDEYGNTRHYIDYDSDLVPDAILLNAKDPFINGDRTNPNAPADSNADAWIELYWADTTGSAPKPKLARAEVYRPNGSGGSICTQYVKYLYLGNSSTKIKHWDRDFDLQSSDDAGYTDLPNVTTPSLDLGRDGDLVQVEVYTAVDLNDLNSFGTAPNEWRAKVTQYRYHDTMAMVPQSGDIRLRTGGLDHQLKMEIMPQQLEFAVQQHIVYLAQGGTVPTPDYTTLVTNSYHLLEKDDGDTVFTELVDQSTIDVGMYEVASKIISYDKGQAVDHLWTSQSPVERQFVQSSSGCGCGSGTTNALMREYTQIDKWNAGFAGTGTLGQSMQITEREVTDFDNEPSGDGYRTYTTDLVMLGESGDKPYEWLVATMDNASIGLAWAHETNYDWAKRAKTGYRTSSAIAGYTKATPTADGIYETTAPTVTHAGDNAELDNVGLIVAFGYEDGTDDNNVAFDSNENISTVSRNGDVVRKTTHRTDKTYRKHLASETIRNRVASATAENDIERSIYSQGFRTRTPGPGEPTDTAMVAWEKMTVERELASENGTGSSGGVDYWSFYSDEGLLLWEIDPDKTLTQYEYDDHTGALIQITRNANKPDSVEDDELLIPSPDPFNGATTSSAEELVTIYTRDEMGRILSVERPGDVMSYTVREMREDPARPGIQYYTSVSLPHYLAGTSSPNQFDGPAEVHYMDAAGTTTRSESYELDPSASYNPSNNADYTVGTQLSQSLVIQDLSGTVNSSKVWWDVSDVNRFYETAYEHDGFGRLKKVTDGNGTVTETEYDVLNRPLQISVGTSAGTHPVASYIYDADSAATYSGSFTLANIKAAQGVGNGNLTAIIQHDGENDRLTRIYYDERDRQIGVMAPDSPFVMYRYDNLDRVIETALYPELASVPTESSVKSDASGVLPTSFSSQTRSRYSRSYYSQRGYLYRKDYKVNPATAGDYYLQSNYWFDDDGNTIARWNPSSPMVITEYDAHDRPEKVFVTDRAGDSESVSGGYYDYYDVIDSAGDHVLEQSEFEYDSVSGAVTKVTHRARLHDTTATGDLSLNSGDNAITTYIGYVYDDAWRRQATINFGTNKTSGLAFSATAATTPNLANYDTLAKLRQAGDLIYTWNTYNTRGLVEDVIGIQEEGTVSTTSAADLTTRYLYDDLYRTVAQVENMDAVTSVSYDATGDRYTVSGFDYTKPDTDRVTSFVYDAMNNVTKRVAHLAEDDGSGGTDEGVQITEYSYGVTAGSTSNTMDSLINSNNLLAEVRYPRESDGLPGTTDAYKVKYAYNRLGEVRGASDQNQTVHAYGRDGYGRVTSDSVTFGTGSQVDTHIERIGYSFDVNGRLEKVTSYEDAAGNTVADEVKLEYTPLWQIEKVWQQHDGVVTSASPRVLYKYASWDIDFTNANQAMNYSRMWTQVYPSDADGAHTVYYHHGEDVEDGSGDNIDNRISRLLRMSVNSWQGGRADVVKYDRIGLGRVALATLPNANSTGGDQDPSNDNEDGIVLDRVKAHNGGLTPGAYPAFDRYGRVIEHRWVRGDVGVKSGLVPTRPAAVEIHHTYDRMSNRLTYNDQREGIRLPMTQRDFDYDGLNRLTQEARTDPTAVDSSYSVDFKSQEWNLDMLGNWRSVTTDDDGTSGFSSATDTFDSRAFNSANEIDKISSVQYDRTVRKGLQSPTYYDYDFDDNGNMTADRKGNVLPAGGDPMAGLNHTYDAWNRLVKSVYNPLSGPDLDVAKYTYNGLGWRTSKELDISTGAYDGVMDQKRYFLYNASWQMVEEHIDTNNDDSIDWKSQQFWGARYIDDAIAKRVDRDANDNWADAGTTRWYQLSDSQFSMAAILNDDGEVYERVHYDAYGNAEHRFPLDKDDSKHIDGMELAASYSGLGTGSTGYDPDMDANMDGLVNAYDGAVVYIHGLNIASSIGDGWISAIDSSSGPDNSIGYAGYVFNPEREDYAVRFRVYDPQLGRWLTRDPIGYVDGSLLFEYSRSSPVVNQDPSGLKITINMNKKNTSTVVDAMNKMCPEGQFKVDDDGKVVPENKEFLECESLNEEDSNPKLCDCLRQLIKSDRDIRIEKNVDTSGLTPVLINNDEWDPDDDKDPAGDGVIRLGKGLGLNKNEGYPGYYNNPGDNRLMKPWNIKIVPWDTAIALAHEMCAHALDGGKHPMTPAGELDKDAYTEDDPIIKKENEYREELGPGYGVRTGT